MSKTGKRKEKEKILINLFGLEMKKIFSEVLQGVKLKKSE